MTLVSNGVEKKQDEKLTTVSEKRVQVHYDKIVVKHPSCFGESPKHSANVGDVANG